MWHLPVQHLLLPAVTPILKPLASGLPWSSLKLIRIQLGITVATLQRLLSPTLLTRQHVAQSISIAATQISN